MYIRDIVALKVVIKNPRLRFRLSYPRAAIYGSIDILLVVIGQLLESALLDRRPYWVLDGDDAVSPQPVRLVSKKQTRTKSRHLGDVGRPLLPLE